MFEIKSDYTFPVFGHCPKKKKNPFHYSGIQQIEIILVILNNQE